LVLDEAMDFSILGDDVNQQPLPDKVEQLVHGLVGEGSEGGLEGSVLGPVVGDELGGTARGLHEAFLLGKMAHRVVPELAQEYGFVFVILGEDFGRVVEFKELIVLSIDGAAVDFELVHPAQFHG